MRNQMIVLFLVSTLTFSCGGGGGGNDPGQAGGGSDRERERIVLGSLDLSSLKGTVEVNKTSTGTQSLLGQGGHVLGRQHFNPNERAVQAVHENGAIVPPPFTDDKGKKLSAKESERVKIKKVMPVNEDITVAVVELDSQVMSLMVDNQDGSLSEIKLSEDQEDQNSEEGSDLAIVSPQIHSHNGTDYLFYMVEDLNTLYRKNLTTGEVVALNNPEEVYQRVNFEPESFAHIPGDRGRFKDTSAGFASAFLKNHDNFIAVGPSNLILIEAFTESPKVTQVMMAPDDAFHNSGSATVSSLFVAGDGHLYRKYIQSNGEHFLWRLYFEHSDEGDQSNIQANLITFGDQHGRNDGEANTLVNVCVQADYPINQSVGRKIVYRNGFYNITENEDKQPFLVWTYFQEGGIDFPTREGHSGCTLTKNKAQLSGDFIYWYNGTHLRKRELIHEDNTQDVYSGDLDNFDVVGGNIYIVKEDKTYLLKDGELELIANTDLEITNVVDFTNVFKEN
jgi:hypothetical protein